MLFHQALNNLNCVLQNSLEIYSSWMTVCSSWIKILSIDFAKFLPESREQNALDRASLKTTSNLK